MKWISNSLHLILLLSLGWGGSLTGAVGVNAQISGPQYVVQPGDTLYDIALRFGMTLDTLQAANPNIDPGALAVGQTLVIPGYPDLIGTLTSRPLEAGESLTSLALRLGLRRATLIQLNRILNPERLYIGEMIVQVDTPEVGAGMPTATTITASAGQGWLALAAAQRQNPWAVSALNQRPHPGTAISHLSVSLPGGERPTKALPAPIADIRLAPLPLTQGATVVVHVHTTQSAQLTGTLGDWPLAFNSDPADPLHALALFGVHRLAEPNLYPLTLGAVPSTGEPVAFTQAVAVRTGQYGVDPPLTVDPATIDPAITGPETEQIRALVAPVTPMRLWDGLFTLPSVGAIRSRFGALRSYNGGPYDSFHGGVDFSGGEDRPITAPAPGVVVFAGPLAVRGNATVIDHGWGVYTGYWHQSVILAQVGQQVQTGEIIGYHGATGRVTGPHLHWEVWVGGNQVEPLTWTEVIFP
jgi:murein DD-endopeptidase MepM/ murein hydrolase activator NlpD